VHLLRAAPAKLAAALIAAAVANLAVLLPRAAYAMDVALATTARDAKILTPMAFTILCTNITSCLFPKSQALLAIPR
jgi:hypothetical protein